MNSRAAVSETDHLAQKKAGAKVTYSERHSEAIPFQKILERGRAGGFLN